MTRGPRATASEPSEEEKSYFRAVEERFCALRGAAMLLSPRDWALIASWWAERVPLGILLECLDEVFAARIRRGEAASEIASLAYVRNEVQRRFRLHRELSALRRGEGEQSDRLLREVKLHLGRISRSLTAAAERARDDGKEALAQALLIAAHDTRALRREAGKGDWSPAGLHEKLERVESEVLDFLRAGLAPDEREAIHHQARELLAERGRTMTPEARSVTLLSMEGELLRRAWGIPGIASFIEG